MSPHHTEIHPTNQTVPARKERYNHETTGNQQNQKHRTRWP